MRRRFAFRTETDEPVPAAGYLARRTGLPKSRIKDAMVKGAVWRKRPGTAERRLRRATALLRRGDRIELYYDPDLLAVEPPPAAPVLDRVRFSVWVKPAGLLSQGTRWGDHCALTRIAERHFRPQRRCFPVHRLDREASGLVLLAHDREAAARMGELFRNARIEKGYLAEVLGDMTAHAGRPIERPLDEKAARTRVVEVRFDPDRSVSVVRLRIDTGRRHQIRRHLDAVGHPVMGDPRYGRGNKNRDGLKLVAERLSFTCPLSGEPVVVRVPDAAPGPGPAGEAGAAAPPRSRSSKSNRSVTDR